MKPYRLLIIISLLLSLASCREEPSAPAAKSYENNFIAHFGSIDPNQTWNLAERGTVTIDFGDTPAEKVEVYAPINSKPYRLTRAYNLMSKTVIPFDMVRGTEMLIVDVDGLQWAVEPGQLLTLDPETTIPQAGYVNVELAEDMKWIMAAEDLGDTNDFDFNDLVLQLTVPRPKPIMFNAHTKEWEEVDDSHMLYQSGSLSRSNSRAWDPEGFSDTDLLNHCVCIKALAAGGTLKLWLHYTDGINDWVIGPDTDQDNPLGYIRTSVLEANPELADAYEWHRWITVRNNLNSTIYNHKVMLNTDFQNNPEDEYGYPLPPNYQDGVTIALPINDLSEFSQQHEVIIASDFSIERYSVTEESPYEAFHYKVKEGFYFTVSTVNANTTGYGNYVELGQAIGHPRMGAAPQVFLIPDQGMGESTKGWLWPKERKDLREAYPDFSQWCRDGSYTTWYLTRYARDLVYTARP